MNNYGWESLSALSVGAVEQAKEYFKTIKFTHYMKLKHGCYSWGSEWFSASISYFNQV